VKPLTDPSPGSPQHFESGSVVVVLGVMYPSVVSQLVEANTNLDLARLPPGLLTGRQSMDVVFYDPLTASRKRRGSFSWAAKYAKNSKGLGHANRTKEQGDVARDLVCLHRKTQVVTTSQLPSLGKTP
jgi:uncharacterized membrane protein